MSISASQAKSLCNASEYSLVAASARARIKALSAAQLRAKIKRARTLRDKWRDQAERQRRSTQTRQAARQTSANARSAEKATLFAEVLERFESQLKATGSDTSTAKTPLAKPKRARSAGHRADRAEVRDELKQTRLSLKAANKVAKPKTSQKTAVNAQPTATAAAKQPATAKPGTKAAGTIVAEPSTRKSNRKRSLGPVQTKAGRATSTMAAAQGLRTTDRKQLRAATRAKQDRLQASGIVRMQKHSSARNKRRQARRDAP